MINLILTFRLLPGTWGFDCVLPLGYSVELAAILTRVFNVRLSLANHSDLLLERLVCLLPEDPQQPWHCIKDAYGVNLWDIYPTCQIAGIGTDNTVIIDGARGASVRWKSFASVHVQRRWSWLRLILKIVLHTSSIFFFVGMFMVYISRWVKEKEENGKTVGKWALKFLANTTAINAWGVIFVVWSLPMLLVAPKMLRVLYGGKLWNTQPWLFGFEGYLPIEQIEVLIFGDRRGRLKWHPFGSPLSRHQMDVYDDCTPVDPCTDPEVRELVEKAKRSVVGDQKVRSPVPRPLRP